MTCKAADDLEAIRAGMRRIEEEKQRMLNGDTSPEPVAVEDYQMDVEDIGVATPTPWGFLMKPTIQVQPPVGSYRVRKDFEHEYWNGRDWVSREYWEDFGDQS
jgi:hypothetical protein